MSNLLLAMSLDMDIKRYLGETENSYINRLCYSALGQWCLRVAQNSTYGSVGTTKHNQTIVLNDLLDKFYELFPSIVDYFKSTSYNQMSIPVHIRRVFEETGYLMTDNCNYNRVANYGRSITIGNTALFFGIPNTVYTVNGLGVFTNSTLYKVSAKEFLIRDNLKYDEYFKSRFDLIDFNNRDIDVDELEFFNPLSFNAPSHSWERQIITNCTLARKTEYGPYYRVIKISNEFLFAEEPLEQHNDSFTSYEYRRLYLALKTHYGKPLNAIITKYDEIYSKITLGGHLPNREYYYLLLLSWPERNIFDKVNFIIRNDFLEEVTAMLTNIGINIVGGLKNG